MRRGVLAVLLGLVCLSGACFERKAGTDRAPRSDAGAVVALRLVQPAHGAVVTRRRPVVRWRAGVSSPGWAVEFCADARCAVARWRNRRGAIGGRARGSRGTPRNIGVVGQTDGASERQSERRHPERREAQADHARTILIERRPDASLK